MGGFGSGGHNSKGRRIVEGQYWLDASDLKRRGILRRGASHQLFWKGGGDKPGPSIRIKGGEGAIVESRSCHVQERAGATVR